MKKLLSLVLAGALLAGCAGMAAADGSHAEPETEAVPVSYALSQPVYPEFPQQPQVPEVWSQAARKAYNEDYSKYIDALRAFQENDPNLTEAEHAALNGFAARSTVLALAGQDEENAVYSPLSLWSALALLAQCAQGESRQQVLDALGVEEIEALQEAASHVWRALYTDDGRSSLLLANSIWLNSNLQGTYVQDTLDTLAQKYYAGTYSVPMGTDAADAAVTDWINQQTNGLIGGDAPVVETDPDILTLLVSSLYYRAAWQDEFDAAQTEEDVFVNASGEEVLVDFMHQTQAASFLRQEGYQAAALRTQLGEMVFVLPDEGVSPASLLEAPDFLSSLEFYGDAAIWGEVQWSVPKFDVDSALDLMDTLAGLGVTDLLDQDRADLSALTDLPSVLSEAAQLARVTADEEGVEAAAVTILVDMVASAMRLEDAEVCVMDLDRPFLFIIRTQDVPLFIGIVNQM